jgi:hypothetical protein
MIDFKEEMNKYNPVIGLEQVEDAVTTDEVNDLIDLLQYIRRQAAAEKE